MAEFDMSWLERLESLEDRVSRLSFQQHRHGDERDSYAAAYARGFQDGFANIRREIESLFLRLVNEPVPSAARQEVIRNLSGGVQRDGQAGV